MGALNKMCIALVSVCVPLGCAMPLQQTTQQIQCTSRNGQILYVGPYNEENMDEYIVQVDDFTQAVYRKGACRRLVERSGYNTGTIPSPSVDSSHVTRQYS